MGIPMQDRLVAIISKPPDARSNVDINLVLPWLQKRSQLLGPLEKHVLTEIVKQCEYKTAREHELLIRQGEKGDTLYIILSGSVGVYIDGSKTGEEATVDGRRPRESRKVSGADDQQPFKTVNKSRFGKFVAKFETGRCFGELALMTADNVRNATIIAEERCQLLLVGRQLFNQTLKGHQEAEYKDRKNFIDTHPLFKNWSPRFKRLLEMSLIKEVYSFDSLIVRQGDQCNGLIFMHKGRAKIMVEAGRHNKQYSDLVPFIHENDIYYLENLRGPYVPPPVTEEEELRQAQIAVKRLQGYAAAERRRLAKEIVLCSVTAGEVFGDIETVMSLPTYQASLVCTEHTEIYALTQKNYERLISKKNPSTLEALRLSVETKLAQRAHSVQGAQVPLLRHLLFKLTEEQKPVAKRVPPLRSVKHLPDRSTLFHHLLNTYTRNKAEVVEPVHPGSIYYREMMREKSRIRDNIRRLKMEKGETPPKRTRQRKYSPKARSIQRLKKALASQHEFDREWESRMILKAMQEKEEEEMKIAARKQKERLARIHGVDLMPSREQQPQKQAARTPSPGKRGHVAFERDERTEQQHKPDKTKADHDAKLESAKVTSTTIVVHREESPKIAKEDVKLPVIEIQPVQEPTDRTNQEITFVTEAFTTEIQPSDKVESNGDTTDTTAGSNLNAASEGQPAEEVSATPQINNSMEKSDQQPPRQTDSQTGQPRTEHHEERKGEQQQDQQTAQQPGGESEQEARPAPSALTRSKTRARFMKALIQRRLQNLENSASAYRDWDTSDKTLRFLEHRIQHFNNTAHPQPVPRLRRFERGDNDVEQPKPGGKVLIKKKPCSLAHKKFQVTNHEHIHYHMVDTIPNYTEMKRARISLHILMDKSSHLWKDQSNALLLDYNVV